MKNENNILEQIGNKNPYKVPENYFEDFANNMDKLIDSMPLPEGLEEKVQEAEPKPAGNVISMVTERLKPLMRVAAVVAILCGTSYLAVQPIIEQAQNEQMMMAEIEFSEDDYQYLLDEYEAEDMYYILTDNK
ncbi:MAG: hypothetical protein IKA83_08720 [Paludibacteraceae bacterium]|nr:hypothetical protein [Paludibacteraceae bacterium]